MNPIKSITWTPNRGKFEPVTEVILARIDLFQNFIEVIIAYDYKSQIIDKFDVVRAKDQQIRSSVLIPKHMVCVSRSIATHSAEDAGLTDTDTTSNLVFIHYLNQEEWIYCSPKEQKTIYNEISKWLKSTDYQG